MSGESRPLRRMEVRKDPRGANMVRITPRPVGPETPAPTFTWAQLEAQLKALRPERAQLAEQLVELLRRRAGRLEPEMLLREMLCVTWTLLEEAPPLAPGASAKGA